MSHECRCGDVESIVVGARESPFRMVPVTEALTTVLQAVETMTQRHVMIASEQANGLVGARAVRATDPFPPFAASIMDGYAVLSSDGAGVPTVVSESTAGRGSAIGLMPGQVAYITTGAPIPAGADAVVPIEWTEGVAESPASVRILRAVDIGAHVRPVGCDIAVDQVLLQAGQMIGPPEIGLLASAGINELLVVDRPTVGVLSTGDEVVDARAPSSSLSFGSIRDSNRPMLLSLLSSSGARTIDLGLVGDEPDALEQAVIQALTRVDMLVLTGGVSMGRLDLLKPLLARLGTVHFGRLNMKPGKPTTFATIGNDADGTQKLVFGLPGNPVSALVTAQLLVVPAIKACRLGRSSVGELDHGYPLLPVTLADALTRDASRPEYHRVHITYDRDTRRWLGSSTGNQMSSRLVSACAANALILVPAGAEPMPVGTHTEAMLVAEMGMPGFGTSPNAVVASAPVAPAGSPSAPAAAAASSSASTVAPPTIGPSPSPFDLRVCVLTVSDRCARGESVDASGPAVSRVLLGAQLRGARARILASRCVPDEADAISAVVRDWCDTTSEASRPHLIVTTGGTGFSPRDVTPEVVRSLLDREAPGFVHAMLAASLRATPMGALSRPVAGTRARTLILTLPGSPRAVPEILEPILPLLPHACRLMQGEDDAHQASRTQK